jgi:hypothetical protein
MTAWVLREEWQIARQRQLTEGLIDVRSGRPRVPECRRSRATDTLFVRRPRDDERRGPPRGRAASDDS